MQDDPRRLTRLAAGAPADVLKEAADAEVVAGRDEAPARDRYAPGSGEQRRESTDDEHEPDEDLGHLDRVAERVCMRHDGAGEEAAVPGGRSLAGIVESSREPVREVAAVELVNPETSHS